MSKRARRNHSYNREDFRKNTFWDIDQTNDEITWNDWYSDDDYRYGSYDYDYSSYDYEFYLEWLDEVETQRRILSSFEYECFGLKAEYKEKSAWCLNFTKTGRKKFIFGIDD